ncbi:hypothetical protein [Hathewaya limosa]|uniref:Uncharacterized protein n=1 Tax=Hathewaya limosa TaxID=1536 RepID=A0ABU0JP47_HATLI|nr:hypothetical protein [Hathewaya limosa]MDQ0478862.1 hypothetical protein [Hathewaya limosa]
MIVFYLNEKLHISKNDSYYVFSVGVLGYIKYGINKLNEKFVCNIIGTFKASLDKYKKDNLLISLIVKLR